jgi:hypothetical protein
MTRGRQFILILCVVVAISSLASHLAIAWLKIRATPIAYNCIGSQDQKPAAFLAGSSLAFHGLDWNRISESLGSRMETWAVAGSSPSEWQVFQERAPHATRTFIVVSAYDLNENWLCDFHADVVPLSETIRNLRQSGADWPFCKKVLSQYPLMVMRKLFPTAGRSDGFMVGIRGKLQKLVHASAAGGEGDAPQIGAAGTSVIRDKITDWSGARLERRLVLMRSSCQGKQTFDGMKENALMRMLQRAESQGQSVLVVLPVSPIYQKEFLTSDVVHDFENSLADVRRHCPRTQIIRLDPIKALNDNDQFWDLVHMNTYGQQIATTALLNQLQPSLSKQ